MKKMKCTSSLRKHWIRRSRNNRKSNRKKTKVLLKTSNRTFQSSYSCSVPTSLKNKTEVSGSTNR